VSLTSIQKEIVRLSSTERAMLIDILWESLDEARVKEIEQNGLLNQRNGSTPLTEGNCRL
jgi:Putative addiction module component